MRSRSRGARSRRHLLDGANGAPQTRPVLHEFLIAVFVTVTTRVTLMILVRAALFRDRSGNADGVPGFDAS